MNPKKAVKMRIRPFLNGLSTWGLWPGLVMVLCQLEAALLLGDAFPKHLVFLTFSGVFAIYGLDRFLERHFQEETEARHQGHRLLNMVFLILIPVLAAIALIDLGKIDLVWLAILGLAGFMYLMATLNVIHGFAPVKELLGVFCFTFLVWGRLPFDPLYMIAFSLMGFSNFLWSGHQDKARDKINGVPSLALLRPGLNLAFARLCAMAAAGVFLGRHGLDSAFFWVSVLHGFWPVGEEFAIDFAFMPLLAVIVFH